MTHLILSQSDVDIRKIFRRKLLCRSIAGEASAEGLLADSLQAIDVKC